MKGKKTPSLFKTVVCQCAAIAITHYSIGLRFKHTGIKMEAQRKIDEKKSNEDSAKKDKRNRGDKWTSEEKRELVKPE